MANKKISDLPAATVLAGTDRLELAQGTTSRNVTLTQLDGRYTAPVTSVDGLTGAVSLAARYVDVTGDTMTGPLIVTPTGAGPTPLVEVRSNASTGTARIYDIGQVRVANTVNNSVGADLLTNGGFTTDLAGWTAGANWAWNAGTAKHTPGAVATLAQTTPSLTSGNYQLAIGITGRTAGSVTVTVGTKGGPPFTATTTLNLRGLSGALAVTVTPTTDFDGAIDAISIKALNARTPQFTADTTIGTSALEVTASSVNIGVGTGALAYGAPTGGSVAFGTSALATIGQGAQNTVLGWSAGLEADQITGCVFVGYTAGQGQRYASDVVAVGRGALSSLATATVTSNSTAVGSYALAAATSPYNDAFGFQTAQFVTTGNVVALGHQSARNVTTSVNGLFVGAAADYPDTTLQPNNVTCIGALSRVQGAQAIAIGYQAQALAADSIAIGSTTSTANQIILGKTTHTTRIPGGVHFGTNANSPHGFFGMAPITRPTVAAAATDPATTMALANSLRTALTTLGLMA